MFSNSKIMFRAEQYHNQNMHMRIFPDLLLVVPASFKLAWIGSLVTWMSSLIGLSWEKEYPSLTVRACDGLSWDTLAGFCTFESHARGYGQMRIC